ncbi:hypothetical protein T265_04923 [Opisthorchis viverrini]|uniref:Transporter, major facilitator family protein n=1 Tax=Opisthorchis viverrini TaxID=6198 RepID=A0A074ZQU0_OPIVI|nr:hypothetical protein T265_04923 [Opisthorchis viverrini]KER28162.1 hypothetical protein T265_04923 [Opisthorchis viverrini]
MRWITRIAHGVGQLQKDLVAGMLAIFAIIYLEQCLGFEHALVGAIVLTGQIMNAISTPLIGYLSDRAVSRAEPQAMLDSFAREYNQSRLKRFWFQCKSRLSLSTRKAWHIYGSILMTISLPCLFGQPESFAYANVWVKTLFVTGFLTLVQVGWAAVQIAHLTLINYLTSDEAERVLLVSLRYLFGSVADISSFIMSYFLLQQNNAQIGATKAAINIGPTTNKTLTEEITNEWNVTEISSAATSFTVKDMPFFRNISLMLSFYGALFAILFQFGVPEPASPVDEPEPEEKGENQSNPTRPIPEFIKSLDELHSLCSSLNEIGRSRIQVTELDIPYRENHATQGTVEKECPLVWYLWFREFRFWICCLAFTTMRTGVTLSMFYLSPFLIHALQLEKSSVVTLPVVIFVTSLVATLVQHRITKLTGRLGNTVVGILFTLGFCGMMWFYPKGSTNQAMLYSAAVLQGIGVAFNNVVAIVVVSDMIGTTQVKTGAFIHGFASLMDKIFTGISVQIIQLAVPALSYRDVLVYIYACYVFFGGSLAIFDYLYWRPRKSATNRSKSTENGSAIRVAPNVNHPLSKADILKKLHFSSEKDLWNNTSEPKV